MVCACILFFHNRSANSKPGYGIKESYCGVCNYDILENIDDWRYLLSNISYSVFYDDYGMEYTSVEQFYQCFKVACYTNIPYMTCHDRFKHLSGEEPVKYAKELIRSDVENMDIMFLALRYKFLYNQKLRNVLKSTGTSRLVYSNTNIGFMFEKIRDAL